MRPDIEAEGRARVAVLVLAASALVALVVATFGRCLSFDFVAWDDDWTIYHNRHIQSLDAASLRFMFTDASYVRIYMPLSWLTLAVVHRLFGFDPWAFHLVGLTAHCTNAVLVFALVLRLLGRAGEPPRVSRAAAALAGASVWAIHPLRTDVVCRASDIFHSQATLLALVAALLYLRASDAAPSGSWRRPCYWLAVASYAASLLTYPHAVAAPLALVAAEGALLGRNLALRPGRWSRTNIVAALEKLPFLAATAAALAANAMGRLETTFFAPPASLVEFGLPERVAQAFYVWAYYLWKPFVPLNLSPVYTPLMEFQATDRVFAWSAALVVVVSVLAVRLWRRFPELLAVWLCHLTLLLPFLGLTEHPHYTADRYSYLASVPMSVLLAFLLGRALESGRQWARPALLTTVCTVVAVLAFLAHGQAGIWKDSDTLYSHILGKLGRHPARAAVYLRLGLHHLNEGRLGEAIAWFDRTLELRPRDFPALSFKGKAQARAGDLEGAAETLGRALAERHDPRLHELRAVVLLDLDRPSEALTELALVLEFDPRSVTTRLWMAEVLDKLGRRSEAVGVVEQALRLSPESREASELLVRLRSALPP
jgi:tetratricopeptide (TPR) repeat protein